MADIKKIKIGTTEYDIKDVTSGYITGITSGDITTALGYTPYDASNPAGYTSNVGTVTSVNSVNPVNGNVTLSIPSSASDVGAVDLDASNLSTAGKSLISGLGMPSDNYDDLTLGASGTSYTAPANGWVLLSKQSTATSQFVEVGRSNNVRMRGLAVGNDSATMAYIPVQKDGSFYVIYNTGGTTNFFRFIYAEGEV